MTEKDLIQQITEKEKMLRQTEIIYHQLQGQIALLKSLLEAERNSKKKGDKE